MKRSLPKFSFVLYSACGVIGLALLASQLGCPRDAARLGDPLPEMAEVETIRASINEAGGGSGGDSVEIDPTGWATFRGVITVAGTPPQMQQLETKTTDPCGVVINNMVKVNPSSKGLAEVVVYLSGGLAKNDLDAAEPKWVHPDYRLTDDTRTVVFDQEKCLFLDRAYAVRTDQILRIKNSDSFPHNTDISGRVNQTIPGNSYFDWEVRGGASRSPVGVSCAIHTWMKSSMMFCDNPYFATTDENGQFEIKNVPAGVKLEFRFWHPASDYFSDVTLNGEAASFSKGKYKLKEPLNDQDELELKISVDGSLLNP